MCLNVSKLTKKGELQSEIDRINERIDLSKEGLSDIAKQYGYQTVQDFYRIYHAAQNAYSDYRDKVVKWEKMNGKITQKPKKESLHEQLQSYQRGESARQSEHDTQRKDRGTR